MSSRESTLMSKFFPIGTRSVLFGVHQFIIHPLLVTLAWRKCYRRFPNWVEFVAICVHDLGYAGCGDLDGHEGLLHPIRGAALAARIAGPDAGRLALWHSNSFSKLCGHPVSALYLPDKVSVLMEPRWCYLLRGLLSGEVWEYIRTNAPPEYRFGRWRPWRWLTWFRSKVRRQLAVFRGWGYCEWCGEECDHDTPFTNRIVECYRCTHPGMDGV